MPSVHVVEILLADLHFLVVDRSRPVLQLRQLDVSFDASVWLRCLDTFVQLLFLV